MGTSSSTRFQIAVVLVTVLKVLTLLGMNDAANNVVGFSTELIPRSLYNPSRSQYEHLQDAIKRSRKRADHFANKLEAPLNPGGGEYVMRISIGTPAVEFVGIADTGSDLTWTQCLPCKQCYKQNIPFYDPSRSSSYKIVPCNAATCDELQSTGPGCGRKNTCQYIYGYGDSSQTQGELSTESLTIGSTVIPNIAFGCSHASKGTFQGTGSGIVGLGAGKLSLISQLGESARKFSYCLTLPSSKSTTKISFGSDALVSGPSVATTPIVPDPSQDTFYFLSLESFTVANKTIPFPASPNQIPGEGNIVIDSGTVLTLLPEDIVLRLTSALEKAIRLPKTTDPSKELNLCYSVEGKSDFESELPDITANFKGAHVVLRPVNTFVEVADGVICLAIVPSSLSIFGNIAQINFLVGYDLDAHALSFKPTDCSKQQ